VSLVTMFLSIVSSSISLMRDRKRCSNSTSRLVRISLLDPSISLFLFYKFDKEFSQNIIFLKVLSVHLYLLVKLHTNNSQSRRFVFLGGVYDAVGWQIRGKLRHSDCRNIFILHDRHYCLVICYISFMILRIDFGLVLFSGQGLRLLLLLFYLCFFVDCSCARSHLIFPR
jgi:hypothetical protein